MSSQTFCPQCGTANALGARFCAKCGTALVSPQPAPTPPYATMAPGAQPMPGYNYAAAGIAQDRVHEIDRTKTGLLLLLIGVVLIPIPFVAFVSYVLLLIGAILVIVGRKAFGAVHARNTIWSIIIFVIGVAVVIAGGVAFALAVVSATVSGISGASINPTTISESLSSAFNILLILTVVGGAIFGIAEVLFTYAIQNQTGKVLLWIAYAASIAVSVINYLIISPLVANAVSQSFSGTSYNPTPLANLQSQLQFLGLLSFIPAIIFATAIYLAWSRVKSGEIPGPIPQPTPLVGP